MRSLLRTLSLSLLLPLAAACAKDDAATTADTGLAAGGAPAPTAVDSLPSLLPPAAPGLPAPGAAPGSAPGSAPGTAAAPPAPPTAASLPSDPGMPELTGYRLTMDKVDRFLAAQRNMAVKFAALSPADRQRLQAENERDAAGGGSFDEIVRRMDGNAMMSASLREAGISAREHAMVTMTLMQASMAASVLDMRPNDNPDSLARAMKVNPANIAFVRRNQAELQRKSDAMTAEMRRLGVMP